MSTATGFELTARQYRWFDRLTKLVGVGLIGAGLDVGGGTATGLGLAAAGVLSGLCTVVISTTE